MTNEEIEAKLRERSTITETCWLWQGGKQSAGYGVVYIERKPILVHRLSYVTFVGNLNFEDCVCHTCDVPACWRPEHLWAGDRRMNAWDRTIKGRNNPKHGENHPHSRLKIADVQEIRRLHKEGILGVKALGRKFDTPYQNIQAILAYQNWKEV